MILTLRRERSPCARARAHQFSYRIVCSDFKLLIEIAVRKYKEYKR